MKHKYLFVAAMLFTVAVLSYCFTGMYVGNQEKGQDGISVVTSFYPMYIATENIVGQAENVTLQNLSEPQTGCMHDYQLTPEDMKLLSHADVFIINGGGIENFLSKVAEAYPSLKIVDASEGVELSGDNSHVWMSVPLYKKQVENIAHALGETDSANQKQYEDNMVQYLLSLSTLEEQQEELRSAIKGEAIVTFHEAYEYLAEDYGLNITYTMDLDEERQVSAGEVAGVLSALEEHHVSVIFAEELYGREMAETVQKEKDVTVCYLDTLVRGDYEADSYLKGMYENLRLIKEAYGID